MQAIVACSSGDCLSHGFNLHWGLHGLHPQPETSWLELFDGGATRPALGRRRCFAHMPGGATRPAAAVRGRPRPLTTPGWGVAPDLVNEAILSPKTNHACHRATHSFVSKKNQILCLPISVD